MKTNILTIVLSAILFFSCSNDKHESFESEIATIESNLTAPILIKEKAVDKFTISDRMIKYKVPGVSVAVVKDGKLHWTKTYQLVDSNNHTQIDQNTLFQAGSISKPIAALAVLKLVEDNKLDLDTDVNEYLTDWKVPESKFTEEEKVTLRNLLTHTAGMTVHGFPGYKPNDTFPDITTVLKGEGNTAAIYVDTIPGSIWRYSGGGYTVMEKVVEDVTGMPFEVYMERHILKPLGMQNSTYAQPLPDELHTKVSAAYNSKGEMIEGKWHNYPEQAAAGLWTTPTDLATYMIEIQESLKGKSNKVLSKEFTELMLTKNKNDWGLGPSLKGAADSLIFGHGGKNAGFTNNLIGFAHGDDGIIVMTNADNGGKLMGEIITSISEYYNWGISKPRIIQPVDIPQQQLEQLVGTYRFTGTTPTEYTAKVTLEDGVLVVKDMNDGETLHLTPLEKLTFIDIENGDEIKFQGNDNFLWNNYYHFKKI